MLWLRLQIARRNAAIGAQDDPFALSCLREISRTGSINPCAARSTRKSTSERLKQCCAAKARCSGHSQISPG